MKTRVCNDNIDRRKCECTYDMFEKIGFAAVWAGKTWHRQQASFVVPISRANGALCAQYTTRSLFSCKLQHLKECEQAKYSTNSFT